MGMLGHAEIMEQMHCLNPEAGVSRLASKAVPLQNLQ